MYRVGARADLLEGHWVISGGALPFKKYFDAKKQTKKKRNTFYYYNYYL